MEEESIEDRSGKYLVVGAGPAGLLAARALRHYGIPHDQVERDTDVGGIWDIDKPWTPMYESAHFISSKQASHMPGLPMPDDYPDYPNHRQILAHIREFARTYDLTPHIAFGTEIVRADRDARGDWIVTLRHQDTDEVRRYRGLFLCTGNTWDPNIPHYPGTFTGETMHSVSYRSPEVFAGRRTLIVGAGNSGCDIACDAATRAASASLSMRRGYHFIPKHIMGQPADVFAGQVTLPPWLERRVFAGLLKVTVGDLTKYGLPEPDHRVLESHPIMNTQVLHHLSHGDLTARPDIASFSDRTVTFTDGTSEEFDLIVYATGYKVTYPYLDDSHFEWLGKYPDLYLSALHRSYDNLCLLGLHQTDGGAYEFFGRQADVMCNYILDQDRNPERAAWFSELKRTARPDLSGGLDYVKSDRHATYVKRSEFSRYVRKLNRIAGWPQVGSEAAVYPSQPGRTRSLDEVR